MLSHRIVAVSIAAMLCTIAVLRSHRNYGDQAGATIDQDLGSEEFADVDEEGDTAGKPVPVRPNNQSHVVPGAEGHGNQTILGHSKRGVAANVLQHNPRNGSLSHPMKASAIQANNVTKVHQIGVQGLKSSFKGGGLFCDCVDEKDLPHDRDSNGLIVFPAQFFGEKYTGKYTRNRTFATFCGAHDADTDPLCKGKTGVPEWCLKKWCFVSEDCACGDAKSGGEMKIKDASLSKLNLDKSPSKRVWFTYENCDPDGRNAAMEHMKDHLKVSVVLKGSSTKHTMLKAFLKVKDGKPKFISDPSLDPSDKRWDTVMVGESDSAEHSRDEVESLDDSEFKKYQNEKDICGGGSTDLVQDPEKHLEKSAVNRRSVISAMLLALMLRTAVARNTIQW